MKKMSLRQKEMKKSVSKQKNPNQTQLKVQDQLHS